MPQVEMEQEPTELIDVSDIEPIFDDEPITATEQKAQFARRADLVSSQAPTIAPLKDRFAAFLLDCVFLYIIYWIALIIFRTIVFSDPAGPIPVGGLNGLLFHSLVLLLAGLWFIIPEMAFGASFGKFCCHLTIRKVDGTHPSFVTAIVRNVFKPIDLILIPVMVTLALLEYTNWQRRLGDYFAGTIVLKKLGNPPRQYVMSADMIALTSTRVFAFIIDLSLFTLFAFGYALLLTPEDPLYSMLLLVWLPVLILFYFVMPEWLTKSSPGKWVWGLVVTQEDGSVLSFACAFIRNLWRIFDNNFFGLFTSLFSVRKQRPGDTAAGCMVIKAPRSVSGLVGFMVVLVVSLSTLYLGLQNRDSLLSGEFKVNFLPTIDIKGFGINKSETSTPNLMTQNFNFAAQDPETLRKPPVYNPGETLFLSFEVVGFKKEGDKVWLQEDISVRYPDNTVGLKIENSNEKNGPVTEDGPAKFNNDMTIPPNAQVGRYTIVLTVRDMVSKQEIKEQRFFYVTYKEGQMPPAGASQPLDQGQPPSALPPSPDSEAPQNAPQPNIAPPPPPSGSNPVTMPPTEARAPQNNDDVLIPR